VGKALICRYGTISEFDLDTGIEVMKIHKPVLFFGACFIDDKLYVSLLSSLFIYDANYKLIKSIPTPVEMDYTHQMTAHGDSVYITDPMRDVITIFNTATENWSEFKVTESGTNTCHVNSVFFDDDLMYVMCHNRGPSDIRVYKDFTLINTIKAGTISHSIWKMRGDIWYCDSGNDSICTIDGKQRVTIPQRGFVRGAAVIGDKVIIGSSVKKFRNPDIFSFYGVTILDSDLNVEKQIPFTYGHAVADIMPIPLSFSEAQKV
jgi:hypothetical protein